MLMPISRSEGMHMRRIFLVFAILFMLISISGCANTAVNEFPHAEVSNYPQENIAVEVGNCLQDGDLEIEVNDFSQTTFFIADISDPERNEPDDKPIDYSQLLHLINSGFVEVMLYDNGSVMEIIGNFTSITIREETDVFRVLDQIALLLLPHKYTYDIDAITHFSADTGFNRGEVGLYRDIKTAYDDAYAIGYLVLTADKDGVVTGLFNDNVKNTSYIISVIYDSRSSSLNYFPTATKDEVEKTAANAFYSYLLSKGEVEGYNDFMDGLSIKSRLLPSWLFKDSINIEEATPEIMWLVECSTRNGDNFKDYLLYANGENAGLMYTEFR